MSKSYFDNHQKLAMGAFFDIDLAREPESIEVIRDDDRIFCSFILEDGLIMHRPQVGGYLTHMLVLGRTKDVSAEIYDIDRGGVEIPGTRRKAPLTWKETRKTLVPSAAVTLFHFEPKAPMLISEKLVIAGKFEIITDVVALMTIDPKLNDPKTDRYDGSPGFSVPGRRIVREASSN
jgi:hypothetical protein